MTLLLSIAVSNAQIKNAKTEKVKIFGNCGMCETNIEKAGNLKNTAIVDWDKDSKIATISYDTAKTNPDEILKRIALAGYDSEKFLAPDTKYDKLHACCQYDRDAKELIKMAVNESTDMESNYSVAMQEQTNQLKLVFDDYFALKDALVKTDAAMASIKAKDLFVAINAVEMETLKMEEHMVWMKVYKNLTSDGKKISETQDVKVQREFFKSVSKNMYELMKVSKEDTPTYYQYCPMVKANWLSKENEVKNPYYGSKMLTCGSTVETIK
ncbi:Copper chaperone CopZ [Flavobacterium degerlachei]|uniref:Copper chaperone CopZ n=2 Tax=Flavobacterium degerlachei TaxID=229203 RepID=A0A1H3EGD3_9FLAO|nr:Copper chaperone CopZ [Flavobacterium degerlachei]